MKDSEARGLVLKRLYDIRHDVAHANASDAGIGDVVDPQILPNLVEQLVELGLADWKPKKEHPA